MSTGILRSIHFADALPAAADELAARGCARRRVSDDPRAAAQPAGAARLGVGVAVVSDARALLRRAPRAAVLRDDAAARVLQRRDFLAGLDQRAAARVAVGGVCRGR